MLLSAVSPDYTRDPDHLSLLYPSDLFAGAMFILAAPVALSGPIKVAGRACLTLNF